MKMTRRELMLAAPAVVPAFRLYGQLASNPFPPYILQQIGGQCDEAYVQAFIRDPSNNINNPDNNGAGSYGGPLVGINGGGVLWVCQQIDAFCQANGFYSQSWGNGGLNSAADVNPDWLKFATNQAQMGMKADYFKLVSPTTVCNAFGIPVTPPYTNGTDLYWGLQALMGIAYGWTQPGGYDAQLRNKKNPFLRVQFLRVQSGSSTPNLTAAGAIGVGMIAGGSAMINTAGGVGVLTGAVVVGSVAVALAWLGLAVAIAGVMISGFAAYRILTQKQGYGGPWYRDPPQTGDPPYLMRIHSRPVLFPPLEPPSPEPTYTISYGSLG